MVVKKFDIQAALVSEKQDVRAGKLREESPLDLSEPFTKLCEACRRGDLRTCQEHISLGVNINARDRFDYTPLILASLCGHYEVARLLLESGALCERDTFQGERCLYNALNDRIRNLLLSYDYSKSTNPLQPLAAHVTSLLTLDRPRTSDFTLATNSESFELHKFILSSRSRYFATLFSDQPEITRKTLSKNFSTEAFVAAIRHLYMGEANVDLGTDEEEQVALRDIEKISRQLEIPVLFEGIVDPGDRRRARQRRENEIERGQQQLATWFETKVLKNKVEVDTNQASSVRWDRENGIFADVLLRSDEVQDDDEELSDLCSDSQSERRNSASSEAYDKHGSTLPIGLPSNASRSPSPHRQPAKSILFPAHCAMLVRSEFFSIMFSSSFREGQEAMSNQEYLQIVPVDCSPKVLEVILRYLYTEKADFGLDMAIDVLYAADLLFIEKLKSRAALIISTLGSVEATNTIQNHDRPPTDTTTTSNASKAKPTSKPETELLPEVVDVYDIMRAAWLLRVPRLEEFCARYIAYRLESYVDEADFAQLVRESAERIQGRQETDTVELIDDIRYYLSERFRLRFEDPGLEDMMDEREAVQAQEQEQEQDEGDGLEGRQILNGASKEVKTADPSTAATASAAFATDAAYTLDGALAGDEFAQDAVRYRVLLGKIDNLLEELKLDA